MNTAADAGPRPVPMLSIGVPAYNSAPTLRRTLDCLLGQSFGDFELIVSDNASTDATWEILQEYARADARVVPLRQAQNIGANGNYTAVFRAARGRYFKWASSNDLCAPEFLARCVAHLEAHPEAVLVAPRTRLFESDPAQFTDYEGDLACTEPDAVDRFVKVLTGMKLNNVLNGVVRADALRRTRLIEHYVGADTVLVGHLALLGHVVLLPEAMFLRRMDRQTATQMMSDEALHRHHYPRRTARSLFPAWRVTAGWVRAVFAARLPLSSTLRALGWILRKIHWSLPALRRDIVEAVRFHTGSEGQR
jgi:glycosyltransferase involved in cell wall biosynthesis